MTEESRTKNCETCGAPFTFAVIILKGGAEFPQRTKCERCAEAIRKADKEREEAEERRQRELSWRPPLVPPLYYDTDRTRLPQDALEEVERWVYTKYAGRGLLCVGPTGKGKTRCCWLLIRRLHIQGIKWMAVTEAEFSGKLERIRAEREGYGWVDRLCATQVLMIDDLGQAATSAKYLEELWRVVEHRCRMMLPIIATTQFSPDELIGKTNVRGGDKTMQAIMRRLQDRCDIVEF